jgi:hypothetical protein
LRYTNGARRHFGRKVARGRAKRVCEPQGHEPHHDEDVAVLIGGEAPASPIGHTLYPAARKMTPIIPRPAEVTTSPRSSTCLFATQRSPAHQVRPTRRISCEAVPPSVPAAGAQGGTSARRTGAALSFVSCIRLFGRPLHRHFRYASAFVEPRRPQTTTTAKTTWHKAPEMSSRRIANSWAGVP